MRAFRLRRGELISLGAAIALVVVLFALGWFGRAAGPSTGPAASGWTALPVLRWLILVAAAAGLALPLLQGWRTAPALPVTMSVLVTTLALITTVALIVRLATTGRPLQAGGFVELAGALALGVGGFLSMRDEDGWTPGPERPIERVTLRVTGPR